MKGKKLLAILLVLVLAISSFTACGLFGKKDKDKDKDKDKTKQESVELTDKALKGDMLIDFSKGADASVVFESDGWTNGDVFNVVWKKENVKYENGKMTLNIVKENKTAWVDDKEVTFPYTAGEARTQNYFGYGDYIVKMKPSANPGTASTFFTCTGPYDSKYVLDADGNIVYNEDGSIKTEPNRHDEIDIEFLGKDTTKVQFNFFVNGKGGNEYMYDLGFDASKEFHEYGFRWEEKSITWFVDGKPVYKVTTDKTVKEAENVRIVEELPYTPGRLLMSHWCGNEGAYAWMGEYEGNVKDNGCEYQWIKTTTKGAPLNPEVTLPDGSVAAVPEVDWSKISAIKPAFQSTDVYTVKNSGTTSNVKYSAVGGSSYINVEMDITAAAKQTNVLHLTLKNNASKDVQVRVNIVDDALLAKGAKNSSTNKAAIMNGAEARTDLEWGGSFFDIPAGETVEAVISFTGSVEKLQLMIDSSRNDTETRAGDITISDIKFAKVGEIIDDNNVAGYKIDEMSAIMKAKADVNVRDLPAIDGNKIGSLRKGEVVAVTGKCKATGWYRINYKDGKVGYVAGDYLVDAPGEQPAPSAPNSIYISGKEYFFDGAGYTIKSDASNNLNVTYSNIEGATYKNISAGIEGLSTSNNKITLKVKNNGSKTVKIRIDVEAKKEMCKNPEGKPMVACNLYAAQDGKEVFTDKEWGGSMFEIAAGKTSTLEVYFDASKQVKTLCIYIDSHDYEEKDKGIKHSGNITFSGVTFGKGTVPSKAEDSATAVDKSLVINGKDITFNNNNYTVVANDTNKSLNVKYSNVAANSYNNINANITEIKGDYNTFKVKVTNNGSKDVNLRVDLTSKDWSTNANTGTNEFVIGANKTVELAVTYDPSKATDVLALYIDSYGKDVATSGDITLSAMEFVKAEVAPPEDDEDKPSVPETETQSINFWASHDENATYTADNKGTSVNLTFEGTNPNYFPCGANEDPVKKLIKENNVFSLKIKNNRDEKITVRLDIKGSEWLGNREACNTEESYSDGANKANTNMTYGGTTVELNANETITLVIKYEPKSATDVPTEILFFIAPGASTNTTADLTLSEFKFANTNSEEPGDDNTGSGDDNTGSGDEGSGDDTGSTDEVKKVYTKINDKNIEVAEVKGMYTPSLVGNDVNITYSNVAGDAYKPVCLWVKEIAQGNDTFHVELTNNGTADVNVRMELTEADASNITNLSAVQTTRNVDVGEYESIFITVEKGSTVILDIKYDSEKETELLFFYFDCARNDKNTYSGDVTLSAMEFKKETVTPPSSGDGDTPEVPTASGNLSTTINGTEVWFGGSIIKDTTKTGYIVNGDKTNGTLRVNYSNLDTTTYPNISANFASVGKDFEVFKTKVTNNGTTEVKVRVDILAADWSATGKSLEFVIPGNKTVELEVPYDSATDPEKTMQVVAFYIDYGKEEVNGDITFSEMKLEKATPADTSNKLEVKKLDGNSGSYFTIDDNTSLVAGDIVESFKFNYVNGVAANYNLKAVFKPVNAADVEGKDTISLKIKNNNGDWGSGTVVQIKVLDEAGKSILVDYDATKVWYNELIKDENGAIVGANLQIAGNEEALINLHYDGTKTPASIEIYPAIEGDENTTITSKLEFSGFGFIVESDSKE